MNLLARFWSKAAIIYFPLPPDWGVRDKEAVWISISERGDGWRRAAKCSGQTVDPDARSPTFAVWLASPHRRPGAAPGEFTLPIDPDEISFLSPFPCNAWCERRSHAAVHRPPWLTSEIMQDFSLNTFLFTVRLIVLPSSCLYLLIIGLE